MEQVAQADEREVKIGVAPKLAAHRQRHIYRAVYVLIFDHVGRMLMERQAIGWHNSAGMLSNTACRHPRPGEVSMAAAARRQYEEMRKK